MTEFEFLEPDFLDEDLRMVRDQVRRFSKERIVPFADGWEASGEIPRSLFRELGELGFGRCHRFSVPSRTVHRAPAVPASGR